jgi:hypothetical protein
MCRSTCISRNELKCYHHQVYNSTTIEALLANLDSSLKEFLERNNNQYAEVMLKNVTICRFPKAINHTTTFYDKFLLYFIMTNAHVQAIHLLCTIGVIEP